MLDRSEAPSDVLAGVVVELSDAGNRFGVLIEIASNPGVQKLEVLLRTP